MGLLDQIKNEAKGKKNFKIQMPEEDRLEKIFNRLFYLPKNIEEETKFINHVLTRGAESSERSGLHASALTKSDNKYCERAQLLSIFYKQLQGEQINVEVKRVFTEGDSVHEKWQRLFIRAGYGSALDMDMTQQSEQYDVLFSPDAELTIPEMFGENKVIVEIKSARQEAYNKMVMSDHNEARKQLNLYLFLRRIRTGIILMENKNTQEFKVWIHTFDKEMARRPVERLKSIQEAKIQLINNKTMIPRRDDCNKSTCSTAQDCVMRDACFNTGMGRVKL